MEENLQLSANVVDAMTGLPFLLYAHADGRKVIVEEDCQPADLDNLPRVHLETRAPPLAIPRRFLEDVCQCKVPDALSPDLLRPLAEFIFQDRPAKISIDDASQEVMHFLHSLSANVFPHQEDTIITNGGTTLFKQLQIPRVPRLLIWLPGQKRATKDAIKILSALKTYDHLNPSFPHFYRYHCEMQSLKKTFIIRFKHDTASYIGKSGDANKSLSSACHVLSILISSLCQPIIRYYQSSEINTILRNQWNMPQEVCDHIYRILAVDMSFDLDDRITK